MSNGWNPTVRKHIPHSRSPFAWQPLSRPLPRRPASNSHHTIHPHRGQPTPRPPRPSGMSRRIFAALSLLTVPLLPSASPEYQAMVHKISLIEHDRLQPGARVVLTAAELNAYARQEIAEVAPEGVRDPRLDLGPGVATATALIDFGKLRRAEGKPPGRIMSFLIDGERPVTITANIRSSGGTATVDVQSVEI